MSAVFDAYAAYYDLLYKDKDYASEAAYVADLVRSIVPETRTVLELGCGTGAHAEHLARMGFFVHGVDMSSGMLQRAETRKTILPSNLAEQLVFSEGDVRTVRLDRKFDAVISLFHVMSYQTENEDVQAMFATAAEHLNPGGVFIFDFWYGPAVLTQRPEVRVKRLGNDDVRVLRIAEPEMVFSKNLVTVNYEVLVEDKRQTKREIFKEIHNMRYFFLPEMAFFLNPAGFMNEFTSYGWMRKETTTQDDWGVVIVAVKR